MRKSFFLVPLLALAMSSCSSDEPAPAPTPDSGDGFYATVNFSMPKGSRAEASDGTETGKDYENKVSSLLVVLAEKAEDTAPYTFITYAYSGSVDAPVENKFTICFEDKASLFEKAGQNVYLFAYCNPTSTLVDKVKGLAKDVTLDGTDELLNDVCAGSAADLAKTWINDGFLMTNHEIYESKLGTEAELKAATDKDKAWQLTTKDNPLEVMRTAVRFDYKDGATAKDEAGKKIALTYDINDGTGAKVGSVKLTRAALFNMRDRFYYLPRITAADGKVTLCPGATASDYDFTSLLTTPATRTFLNGLKFVDVSGSAAESFDPTKVITDAKEWCNLQDFVDGKKVEDTDTPWNAAGDADKQGYRIWRYCTENTYPTGATTFPTNEATGFVFEAEMTLDPVTVGGTTIQPDGTNPMFLYGTKMYANAQQLCQTAHNNPSTTMFDDVNAVFSYEVDEAGNVTTTNYKTGAIEANKTVLTHNISIYWPKDGKYYCYYYYFNQHNPSAEPTTVAVDEFATVRNNVYKLSVTKISEFASFVPPTEIKPYEVYFKVDVEVRPWTVRINNIEF